MLIKFNKKHTNGINQWKKGDVANVVNDFAARLVSKKIASYVDGKTKVKKGISEEEYQNKED